MTKGSRDASKADADHLQVLASRACECTRKRKNETLWEPLAYETKDYSEAPPTPCWQEFAKALRPFKFNNGAVAACGPGSDQSHIVLGRDQQFYMQEKGWSETDDKGATIFHPPPKDRALELYRVQLHLGFGTCTSAEFAKAKAKYEDMLKQPTCG